MEADQPPGSKTPRSLDSAYSFSVSIALGLALFIGGLVISLTFANTSVVGLIFGVPLILAGLAVPLVMMRNELFTKHEVAGECPHCAAPLKTSDATLKLECPGCGGTVVVRDMTLRAG